MRERVVEAGDGVAVQPRGHTPFPLLLAVLACGGGEGAGRRGGSAVLSPAAWLPLLEAVLLTLIEQVRLG
jgi:hypothetical protein